VIGRADLQRHAVDGMIAATALDRGAVLVSNPPSQLLVWRRPLPGREQAAPSLATPPRRPT
jgi:hypothetical protein